MIDVRYPALRADVLDAIEALADLEYQARVWRDGEFPGEGAYESLDMVVHALYDDAQLDEGAAGAVGDVLRDDDEADALNAVIDAMESVFTELGGTDVSERDVLAASCWPRVVEEAQAALRSLRRQAP